MMSSVLFPQQAFAYVRAVLERLTEDLFRLKMPRGQSSGQFQAQARMLEATIPPETTGLY